MKRKKRGIADQRSPSEDELYDKISQMAEPWRSYAAFTYLFGNRVSEGLGRRKGPRQPLAMASQQEWLYEPLQRWRITVDENPEEEGWITANIVTLKRKGRPRHNTYLYYLGPGEKRFVDLVMQYADNKDIDEYIWTHGRISQWVHTNRALGISPHKLRALRATKDVITYDLDTASLQKKFNWARAEMAIHYTSLNQKDIMKKMKKAVITASSGNS